MLGHAVNEEELDDIIDEFDEDESGEIEFSEFLKLASRFVEPEEDYDTLRKELREVFMLYDKEARGYLPLDEFKKILREIDPELPEDELDEIIDEIDADGSGTIDFDGEFDVIWVQLSAILHVRDLLHSFFKSCFCTKCDLREGGGKVVGRKFVIKENLTEVLKFWVLQIRQFCLNQQQFNLILEC